MTEMTVCEAMTNRHSVRSYTDRRIEGDVRKALEDEIAACNAEGGLHMQLIMDEPEAFGMEGTNIKNAVDYIAMVGPAGDDLEVKLGYYGEKVVLKAQQLGLNTCWAAGTFQKDRAKCQIGAGEALVLGIAIGYGADQGAAHKSKDMSELCTVEGEMPGWFKAGMEAAMLAPTAINQQKFRFELKDGKVHATTDAGPCIYVDLGIAKYHFECGAGKDSFEWA